LIPYEGNDSWLEETVRKIHLCLISSKIPDANDSCDYCSYRSAVEDVL